MAKVFSRYFDNSSPQPAPISESIVVPGSSFTIVALPVPPEGRLTRLIVKQLGGEGGGSPTAYNIELFECSGVYPVGNNANDTEAALDTTLYSIIPIQNLDSGETLVYRSDVGTPYRNSDVSASTASTGRAIYLAIEPQGAGGPTTWLVSYTVWAEIGG